MPNSKRSRSPSPAACSFGPARKAPKLLLRGPRRTGAPARTQRPIITAAPVPPPQRQPAIQAQQQQQQETHLETQQQPSARLTSNGPGGDGSNDDFSRAPAAPALAPAGHQPPLLHTSSSAAASSRATSLSSLPRPSLPPPLPPPPSPASALENNNSLSFPSASCSSSSCSSLAERVTPRLTPHHRPLRNSTHSQISTREHLRRVHAHHRANPPTPWEELEFYRVRFDSEFAKYSVQPGVFDPRFNFGPARNRNREGDSSTAVAEKKENRRLGEKRKNKKNDDDDDDNNVAVTAREEREVGPKTLVLKVSPLGTAQTHTQELPSIKLRLKRSPSSTTHNRTTQIQNQPPIKPDFRENPPQSPKLNIEAQEDRF